MSSSPELNEQLMKNQIGTEEIMVSGFFYCKKILKELGFEITGGYCDPTKFHAVVELGKTRLRIEFVFFALFNLKERGYNLTEENLIPEADFYIFCIPAIKNHKFWVLSRDEMEIEINGQIVKKHYIGVRSGVFDALDLKEILIPKYAEKWQKIH